MDNRHNHPHDPLPEFIFVWTAKRYGLRDLVGTTRHDIAHAAQVYDDVPEVRTFLAFMLEDYDTEQLSFYLYARAVIHDRAATNDAEKALAAAFSHDSGTRPPPLPSSAAFLLKLLRCAGPAAEMRYIPLSVVHELVNATFSERISPNNREAILAYAEQEAVIWTPPAAEAVRLHMASDLTALAWVAS